MDIVLLLGGGVWIHLLVLRDNSKLLVLWTSGDVTLRDLDNFHLVSLASNIKLKTKTTLLVDEIFQHKAIIKSV